MESYRSPIVHPHYAAVSRQPLKWWLRLQARPATLPRGEQRGERGATRIAGLVRAQGAQRLSLGPAIVVAGESGAARALPLLTNELPALAGSISGEDRRPASRSLPEGPRPLAGSVSEASSPTVPRSGRRQTPFLLPPLKTIVFRRFLKVPWKRAAKALNSFINRIKNPPFKNRGAATSF